MNLLALAKVAGYAMTAVGFVLGGRRHAQRAKVVSEALRGLGAEIPNAYEARIRGIWVRCSRAISTDCTCLWPCADLPFAMRVRPRRAGLRRRARAKAAAEVSTDDAGFEEDFVVVGAPPEIIRSLLDAEVRETLRWFHPCEIGMSTRKLVFSKRGDVAEPEEIRKIVGMAVGMAERLKRIADSQ